MTNLRAQKLISSRNISIPTLPAVVAKVQRMMEDPNTGAKELGDVVAEDAPISAKVLKIANSAYYGLRERCLQPQHATAVLGVRVLRSVVTQAAVISRYEHLKGGEFDLDAQWKHSILVAQACAFLGKRCKGMIGVTPDELYVCGLLHDLGKVVILECLKDDYMAVMRYSSEHDMPLHRAETERLGFTHCDVGAIVAQQWCLPHEIASAIQLHHGPREAIDNTPVASLVTYVNLLVHRVCDGQLAASVSTFDPHAFKLLGITGEDVNVLAQFVDGARKTVVV
jgi:HD-like signal output (HDOD) protein